jgi:hypothetical protein
MTVRVIVPTVNSGYSVYTCPLTYIVAVEPLSSNLLCVVVLQTFEANSWLWIPDDKEMYLPGKVLKAFKPGEEGKVQYEDGKVKSARFTVISRFDTNLACLAARHCVS